MQKKLLTMAVAGAFAVPGIALAQSSVEVYGTINVSASQFKYSADTAGNAGVSKWDVASHASNYGVRGRESLGGGLNGWFQIEQNAPMERSNNIAITPASRNSAVGMQGGFGNVYFGQWTTPWADLDGLWYVGMGNWPAFTSIIGRRETTGTAPNANCINAPGGSGSPAVVSPQPQGTCDAVEAAGGVGHAFWRRASQAIRYDTPVMGGVQGNILFQTNEGRADATAAVPNANASLWSASVVWSGMGGRARVGGAFDRHKDFTTIGNTDTGLAVKGGWNFGVVDLGLAIERMTYKCGGSGTVAGTFQGGGASGLASTCNAGEGDVKAKQYGISASIPVGPGAIKVEYAKAKDLESNVVAANRTGTGAKMYNVGYQHTFSKRTSVGVGYAKIVNDIAAVFTWTGAPPSNLGASNTPGAGSDPSSFYFNIRHRF